MSYYATAGKKYKDLSQFLRKFRCKNCHIYGMMKAISTDKKASHMIQALICANCKHVAPLEMPIDRHNIGKTSTGLDKRPTLTGKSTKFKMPVSESEKTGLNRALRKSTPNRNIGNSKTKLITDETETKPGETLMNVVHRHIRRAGLPNPTQSTIMKVQDIDPQDQEFSQFMRGMNIVRQVSTPPEKVRQGIFLY